MKKICVIGVGYVGIVTAACFADLGNKVIALDINKEKIDGLRRGEMPIYEPGLKGLVERNVNAGRLSYTTSYAESLDSSDFVFIAVGTPERSDGSANLDYVFNVAKQIAQNVTRDCIVVVKSTVPIGTNDDVENYLRKHLVNKVNIDVASNPEFLAQGTAVKDTLEASRIVIGAENEKGEYWKKTIHRRT